ncbi:hypothetical protein [Sphingomonas sp.]
MPRSTLILIVVLAVIVIGAVLLSRRPSAVPTHRIEQPVTLNGAADAGK